MAGHSENPAMPIVRELKDFDLQSGSGLERFIFNNRVLVFLACLIATVLLGVAASRIEVISYGKERPIAQGSTEAAHAQNRNAHTVVTGGR